MQDAASLTSGTQQNGVVRAVLTSALGRVLFRSTWKAGTRLEHAAFAEDRVGQLDRHDPLRQIRSTRPTRCSATCATTRSDSSSRSTTRRRRRRRATFDTSATLTEIAHTPISPEPTHSLVQHYDAYGRVLHREEQNGGVTDRGDGQRL